MIETYICIDIVSDACFSEEETTAKTSFPLYVSSKISASSRNGSYEKIKHLYFNIIFSSHFAFIGGVWAASRRRTKNMSLLCKMFIDRSVDVSPWNSIFVSIDTEIEQKQQTFVYYVGRVSPRVLLNWHIFF